MEQVKKDEKKRIINLNLGLNSFQSIITNNFSSIQETMDQHEIQIIRINGLIQSLLKKQVQNAKIIEQLKAKSDVNSGEKHIENNINKIANEGNGNIVIQQDKKEQKQSQLISKQGKQSLQNTGGQHQTQLINHKLLHHTPNISSIGSHMIEDKIFQLFERLRLLQQRQMNTQRFSLKKFHELEFQIQQSMNLSEKNRVSQRKFVQILEHLKNELSDFQLKKQSQIIKLMNMPSSIQNQTGGLSYGYMALKLQQLLKNSDELLTNKRFEEENKLLNLSIENIRKRVNEGIGQDYLQQSLKNLQARIYHTILILLKNKENMEQKKGELQNYIMQEDKQLHFKMNKYEDKFKIFNQQIEVIKGYLQIQKRDKNELQEDLFEQIRKNQSESEVARTQIEQLKRYIQQMKQNMNQKYLSSESQINQLQDSLQRIIKTLKKDSLPHQQGFNRTIVSSIKQNPQSHNNLDRSMNGIDMQNDLKSQIKKMNKLTSKVQGLKEDILNYRQDMMREIDGIKGNLEKKADWESLKKAMGFLEQKIKQNKIITQAIYQSTTKQENGDSLAVKKGWTCLVCDKDIKNYDGKLGDIKFTSMFPARQSPRIGGYYKQHQASQQYKQVFMNNSNGHNRNRRITSLKSNQSSKEELQS